MNVGSLVRLVLLGAIWGGSFLFMRIAVPGFGPPTLIGVRLGLATVFLATVAVLLKRRLPWRAHWRRFAIIGATNSAIPFVLFAYAAKTLPASILALINSLAPVFGAIVSSIWLKTPVSTSTRLGLLLGVLGVAALGLEPLLEPSLTASRSAVALALMAAVAAPLFYGIAATFIRTQSAVVDAFSNAHGSMWAASLVVLFPALAWAPATPPSTVPWLAAIALGVVCTGAAYLLQFRLIADLGPIRALSVTFLIPVFGVLWGIAFLDEPMTASLAGGGILILAGMYLTLRTTLATRSRDS